MGPFEPTYGFSRAERVEIPTIIKAREDSGRRLVDIEAGRR
jgi:hypothetical protein